MQSSYKLFLYRLIQLVSIVFFPTLSQGKAEQAAAAVQPKLCLEAALNKLVGSNRIIEVTLSKASAALADLAKYRLVVREKNRKSLSIRCQNIAGTLVELPLAAPLSLIELLGPELLPTGEGSKRFPLVLLPAKGVSHVELTLCIEDAQGRKVSESLSVTWRAKPFWPTQEVLTYVVGGVVLTLAAVVGLRYYFQGGVPSIPANAAPNDQHSQALSSLGNAVIGKAEWERYFGNVGSAPRLPRDIAQIMDRPCPFWDKKKVKDTHLLVLIPEQVGGKALTLDYLGELIEQPQGGGYGAKYRNNEDSARKAIGSQGSGSSYWVLMTRDVLSGSTWKSYADQLKLVVDYADYRLPSVLEASVVILLHHVRSGELLYSGPWRYTRCRDKDQYGLPMVVGGFSSMYLTTASRYFGVISSPLIGVAVLRKF